MNKTKYKKIKWLFGKEIKIPYEWKSTTLGDIGKFSKGKGLSKDEIKFSGKNKAIPYTAIYTDFDEKIYCDKINNYTSVDNSVIINGPYLLMASSSNMLKNIGKAAAINASNVAIGGDIIIYKTNANIYFLSYLLSSNEYRGRIVGLSQGITIVHIYPSIIHKLRLNLPPLTEQIKIASILSGVDATIEATQKTIEKTEILKKGLMQQLLTRGISHKKFKKVKWLFGKTIEIPQEWTIKKLNEVCNIRQNDKILSNLYVGLEHIGQGNNQIESTGTTDNFTSTKNTFRKGDVLYGKLRPLLNKVWLATNSGYCSTDILPLMSTSKIHARILLFVLTSSTFLWYAVGTSAGTKMPRTSWSDMKKFPIILPNVQEQTRIASILSGVDAYIQKNQEYKKKLEELKKGLMQKLLTGQIRVKV